MTLAGLWQADRDGLQGAFLQPIAPLLARKATLQTARARLITDRRELCRGSHSTCSEAEGFALSPTDQVFSLPPDPNLRPPE